MKNIFSIILLCISSVCQAQITTHVLNIEDYAVLDSANIEVVYQLNHISNKGVTTKDTFYDSDIQVLQIGDKYSKFYSQNFLDYSFYIFEFTKKIKGEIPHSKKSFWGCEIFKNYPQLDHILIKEFKHVAGQVYYTEPLNLMKWNLEMEADTTILDYKCHKATTNFRGRNYTAWFTTDIPINNGPWKFGGLPGLILKIYDADNYYKWEAIGIKEGGKDNLIKEYNYKHTKQDRLKLMKTDKIYHKDPAVFYTNQGITVIKMNDEDGTHKEITTSPSLDYNPIELE